MKRKLFFLLLLANKTLLAQDIFWANKVLEVSSEHTDAQYSPINRADQILGKPNVFPQMGASPCAWQPNGSDFGEDYIKVGFEKALNIKQIGIVENRNPGAVVRIFGYDEAGGEHLLYQNSENAPKVSGRFWQVKVESAPKPIKAIKLLISHRSAKGIKQYDAIGISESNSPLKLGVNLAKEMPENLQKENLGNLVNSRWGELAPLITPDGKTLYFTRNEHPDNLKNNKDKEARVGQDIWVSKLGKNGQWESPANIGKPINNEMDNAAATVSAEGNSLYILNVYNANGTLRLGLSQTKQKNGDWTFPEEVKIMNFQALSRKKDNNDPQSSDATNAEFSISHDKKVLIMGLKRSKTFGDNDLYVSFLKPDGTYDIPQNLGNSINTADNEGSPFLSADNKTLYFSSKGHPGYGNADIFVSRRLDDTWTNWSEPENLGPQINSPLWDGYFSIPASGDFAFLSSKDNSIGEEDIFRIKLFESIKPEPVAMISGSIINSVDNSPLDIKLQVSVLGDTTGKVKAEVEYDAETKEYKLIVPVGYQYKFVVEETGYMRKEEIVDLSNDKSYREIKKNFEMMPLEAGQKVVLNQLYFEQGKYEIKKESFEELDKLLAILKNYPKMVILLEGYTDNQGDFSLNVKLSESRVNAVREYLIKKGNIAKNRIAVKAWGPLKPISSNSDEQSRQKNRRVEFSIVSM